MDFFANQETARTKTKILIGYFILSIISLIGALYLIAAFSINWIYQKNRDSSSIFYSFMINQPIRTGWLWWDQVLFFWVSGITISIIAIGSSYKIIQLSEGGKVIALDLGGYLITPDTTNTYERRLLNVVEEMAIASGMPMPEVYILPLEKGINAFAAGNHPGDAVIGVTDGCLKLLNRDEIQGVIAHEFSHILNGDMKLNLKLVGFIHGILIISIIGQVLMRVTAESYHIYHDNHSNNSDDKKTDLRTVIYLIGVAIYTVGSLGGFFGNLIKSSVSRQREFLADAAAVQFTRNPDGISRALQKIGGFSEKSHLNSPYAQEASHMMFGQCMTSSRFASHPPLEERIKRITPHWDGTFIAITEQDEISDDQTPTSSSPINIPVNLATLSAYQEAKSLVNIKTNLTHQFSNFQINHAKEIYEQIPADCLEDIKKPQKACLIIYACLLSKNSTKQEVERSILEKNIQKEDIDYIFNKSHSIATLSGKVMMAMIDLSFPTLRSLTKKDYLIFSTTIHELVHCDQQVDTFEFMVQRMIKRHLDIHFNIQKRKLILVTNLKSLITESQLLLSFLARASSDHETQIEASYTSAKMYLATQNIQLPDAILQPDWQTIDTALNHMASAAPLVKKQFLAACVQSVYSNHVVNDKEIEILRAISDAIDIPMPPLHHLASSLFN